MILHAYCIHAEGETPGAEVRGIAGAEVRGVDAAGVCAWVSRLDAPAAPGVERAREHDGVVRAALASATPLPLRFGTVFEGEAALRAVLEERAPGLRSALERLRGRVETGIAVGWDADAARARILAGRPDLRPVEGRPASGRAYLEARRREHALEAALREAAEGLLSRVSLAVLGALPDAEEVRVTLPRPGVAGTLAHLVQRSGLIPYRETVRRAAEEVPEAELRLSGPWAPYSFV